LKSSQSTSFNRISGDVPKLNLFKKIVWHVANYIDNHFPMKFDESSFEIKEWNVSSSFLESILRDMPNTKILPRAICDIFWKTLDYNKLSEKLSELNVLDVGCGSARVYVEFLSQIPNLSYTGIDIEHLSDWDELKQKYNIKFLNQDICEYLKREGLKENLLVSQSVLEHVERDFFLHEILSEIIKTKKNKRVIQIHLVPAVACHSIYGIHGYRHYDLRKLSRISSLYKNFSDCYVVPLGDKQMNIEHSRWAKGSSRTSPRFLKPQEYVSVVQKQLVRFFTQGSGTTSLYNEPTFYAYIIDSNNNADKLFLDKRLFLFYFPLKFFHKN
jgi:SAM-dependent methyltransferase